MGEPGELLSMIMLGMEEQPEKGAEPSNQEHKCKNCGHEYHGNYCPNCGQRYITRRFSFKQSIFWIFQQIFNLERGLLYTTREVLLRPAEVFVNYLGGATVRYMHPFRFLFVWATINVLVAVLFGVFDEGSTFEFNQGYEDASPETVEAQRQLMEGMKRYLSFITMANVPFLAIGSWLFYRKHRLNYTEHLIMIAFGYGTILAVLTPLNLLLLFPNMLMIASSFSMLLPIVFIAWGFHKLFKEHFLLSLLKMIATMILALLLIIILVAIGIAVFAILKAKAEGEL